MTADADLLARLGSVLDAALESALPAEAPVALIGIPLWTNVGDHAIFLGTLRWLQRHGHEVAHSVADARDYSPSALRRALGPDGVIALAGGATVGDTWPERQRFRERVLAENGDVPIVQLPQSIHFDDPAAAARASEAFAAHPRFTLMARDADSEERARSLGCDPVLAPDIAFALDPLPRPSAPEAPVVSLIRRDRESALPTSQPPPDSVDWAAPDPLARRLPVQGAHLASRTVARSATLRRLALRRYTAYGEKRLEAGAAMLSRGRAVISDRIHAHILCLLLGIPHVVLDSRYGKTFSFRRSWTAESALARSAADLATGVSMARGAAEG